MRTEASLPCIHMNPANLIIEHAKCVPFPNSAIFFHVNEGSGTCAMLTRTQVTGVKHLHHVDQDRCSDVSDQQCTHILSAVYLLQSIDCTYTILVQ